MSPIQNKIGLVSGKHWYNIKRSAANRNIELSITQQYIWDLLIVQDYKCIYTGSLLLFSRVSKYNTASLDRIDNDKGYIEGNVQWVHKDVNMAKRKMSHIDFIKLCSNISKYNEAHIS